MKTSHILQSAGAIVLLGCIAISAQTLTLKQLQDNYIAMKFGIFLHFNMSTFSEQNNVGVIEEHEEGDESNNLFAPKNLNCGQWADAVRNSGARYAVLTVKHHGGFCLWPTATTTHSVKNSTWRSGKGDVVKEFVDSMTSRGIKVGFFYSIWDKNFPGGQTTDLCVKQITELLTNYGPISVIWTDGWGWNVGYEAVGYDEVRNAIKKAQPNCILLENSHEGNLTHTDIVGYERDGDGLPPTGNTLPSEVCFNMTTSETWFYHPTVVCGLKDASVIVNDLKTINSRKANMLLNCTPTDTGVIPACQVTRLKQIQAAWGEKIVDLPSTRTLPREHASATAKDALIDMSYDVHASTLTVSADGPFSVSLLNTAGQCVRRFEGSDRQSWTFTRGTHARGVYTAVLATSTGLMRSDRLPLQ